MQGQPHIRYRISSGEQETPPDKKWTHVWDVGQERQKAVGLKMTDLQDLNP
jgi:hypothetical protein